MSVCFCVVEGENAAAIANIVQPFAEQNPVGRKLVRPGDPEYPAAVVAAAIAGVPNAGAVVLKSDGTVSIVLSADDAQNGLIIIDAFSQAAL
jgi:hypothetical protein